MNTEKINTTSTWIQVKTRDPSGFEVLDELLTFSAIYNLPLVIQGHENIGERTNQSPLAPERTKSIFYNRARCDNRNGLEGLPSAKRDPKDD